MPQAVNFDTKLQAQSTQRHVHNSSKSHGLLPIAIKSTTMPSDEPPTDRAALVNRQLPEMTLSDASPSSNTYPSNPPSSAEERFRVRGTAVRT